MNKLVKFGLIAIAIYIIAQAWLDKGVWYDPTEHGMDPVPKNDIWREPDYKKFNPKRMTTE